MGNERWEMGYSPIPLLLQAPIFWTLVKVGRFDTRNYYAQFN